MRSLNKEKQNNNNNNNNNNPPNKQTHKQKTDTNLQKNLTTYTRGKKFHYIKKVTIYNNLRSTHKDTMTLETQDMTTSVLQKRE